MSIVSKQQLAAFHATDYQVDGPSGPFTLHIGRHSAELQQLHEAQHATSSAYLTAWNALGEMAPAQVNAERQEALQRDLAGLRVLVLSGQGKDPAGGWAEDSLLAVGLSPGQARELGNRYQQLAIVVAAADAVPQLVLLR